jgi:hypothetical protein
MAESKATIAAVEVEHDKMVDKAAQVEAKHDRALDKAEVKTAAISDLVAAVAAEYGHVRWHPNAKGMDLVKLDAAIAELQAAV